VGLGMGVPFETGAVDLPAYARLLLFSDGVYEIERPIAPKLAEFEKYLHETLDGIEVAHESAATVGV